MTYFIANLHSRDLSQKAFSKGIMGLGKIDKFDTVKDIEDLSWNSDNADKASHLLSRNKSYENQEPELEPHIQNLFMSIHSKVWENTKEDINEAIEVIHNELSDNESDSEDECQSGNNSDIQSNLFSPPNKKRMNFNSRSHFSPKLKRKNTGKSQISILNPGLQFPKKAENLLRTMVKNGDFQAHCFINSLARTFTINEKYIDFVCDLSNSKAEGADIRQLDQFTRSEVIHFLFIRFRSVLNYFYEDVTFNEFTLSFFETILEKKSPLMIALMELYFTGKYNQGELIETLFLIEKCVPNPMINVNPNKETFKIKVSFP